MGFLLLAPGIDKTAEPAGQFIHGGLIVHFTGQPAGRHFRKDGSANGEPFHEVTAHRRPEGANKLAFRRRKTKEHDAAAVRVIPGNN